MSASDLLTDQSERTTYAYGVSPETPPQCADGYLYPVAESVRHLMSDLTAEHYLGIYQIRLRMAEKGITHPRPEVVEGTRRLIAGLSILESSTPVRLEIRSGKAVFTIAGTGESVVEIELSDPAEPCD